MCVCVQGEEGGEGGEGVYQMLVYEHCVYVCVCVGGGGEGR